MSRRRAIWPRSGCGPLRGSGRGPMSCRRAIASAAALGAAAVIPLLTVAAPVRAQSASPCDSATVVPAGRAGLRADCEALWDFYTRLDDPGELDDPGPGAWGPGAPLSSWRGVEISPLSGRVNALNLFARGLDGPVSPGLGKLTELLGLNIGSNRLSGSIPAELGRLSDLVVLNLSRNRLTGPIPAELGRLANLTQMSLYENELTGPLPPELGGLANLVEFEYYRNRFEGPWPSGLRRFNPYLSDPLGLISNLPTHREHSLTNETWDVWFCDTPAGDVALDAGVILPLFNDRLTPYFRWLSDGRYRPRFRHAGAVTGADMFGCSDKAAAEASTAGGGSGNRRLIVADEDNGLGVFWGTSVLVAASASSLRPVGPDGLDPESGLDLRSQWLYFVAHEMGHAVGFPHSYGGRVLVSVGFEHRGETLLPEGTVSEYDNPMDVMSNLGNLGGTVAVNRYAAGWIDPANVAVHPGGAARTYELRAPGLGGTQMLVLPSDDFGIFTMLGARAATGYDSSIPKEGVEVYRVTHRVNEWRNQPLPPAEEGSSHLDWTRHVHPAGEKFEAGGAAVEVLSRSGGRFTVRVGPGRSAAAPSPEPEPEAAYDGRFSDDDDSAHEANIEIIAARGITVGCDPARPDRFCPSRPVTRAQMMAFLGRALGPSADGAATGSRPRFTDVPADAWYRPHLERLAALGAVEPYADGTFRPSEPLIRRDMAVLLARAFSGISPVAEPAGTFTDVPAGAPGAAEVEGVLAAGVTRGCSARPMRYCPGDSVTRAQMASFLARALRADRPAAGSAPSGSAGSS